MHFSEPTFPLIIDEPFDCSWDFGVAAQHIVLTHFKRMLGWRATVWENEELEGVHQIRVEARRTRTALQTFSELWNKSEVKSFSDYLSDFATAFGDARDLDVMIIYLEAQLASADSTRAAAYQWLLDNNRQKRASLQPKLEKLLGTLDRNGFPAAFTAYFASKPFDLWSMGGKPEEYGDAVGAEVRNG